MAKFIKDIHEFINFLTGKGETGYHSPEERDNAVDFASRGLFDEKKKLFQETQEITEDLKPFFSDPTPITPDINGKANYPANYSLVSSIRVNDKPVIFIDDAFLGHKLNDPIAPPTTDYPICAFYKDYIQFYPKTGLTNVVITYLKTPVKAKWAYDIVSEREVYNDDDSIDIEWKEPNHAEIIMRTLSYLGINLRENTMIQYSEMKKNQVV